MASTGEEFGLFWNSVNGDRTYDSDSFSKWLKKFFTTGVFNGDFQVVANSGMQVKVKGGYANIAGKVYFMDNDKTLTLAVANSTYPRIDTIVITCDYINRRIFVENITGQLSGNSPIATAPVRNTEKYQIVLAQIRVNAGVTSITQAQITDTRTNNNLCGYIAGTVTQMNFAQFTAQFESYFTQFKNNNLASFNTWFQGIKDQLTDDVAGNLQSQIDSNYNELKDASNINYSRASSGLSATKVQGAIDEVNTKANGVISELTANGNRIYMDYKNGKYGYNTSADRAASTFHPFKEPNTATYTFPSGVGSTVDLGEDNVYRYVNAQNVYSKGVSNADGRANPSSVNYQTGYNQGVSDADNRANPSSYNYQSGVSAADNRVNTSSASYQTGYSDGRNPLKTHVYNQYVLYPNPTGATNVSYIDFTAAASGAVSRYEVSPEYEVDPSYPVVAKFSSNRHGDLGLGGRFEAGDVLTIYLEAGGRTRFTVGITYD